MEIKPEQKDTIINLGALGYSAEKIAIVLDIDVDIIQEQMSNKESEFYKLYNKGVIMSEYVLDLKLFEMAKTGDIEALDKLEFRKHTR